MDDRSDLQNLSAQLSRMTAQAAPAVVAVQSNRALSSGFVWRDGLVVTADEALAWAQLHLEVAEIEAAFGDMIADA